MHINAHTLVVVLAVVLSAGIARAAEEHEQAQEGTEAGLVAEFVSEMDSNLDGMLSLAELSDHEAFANTQNKVGEHFAAADADGDGSLDTREAATMLQLFNTEASHRSSGEGLLAETDVDKDGKVSLAEIQAKLQEEGEQSLDEGALNDKLQKHFAASDTNGDSFLEGAEVAKMMKRLELEDQSERQEAEKEDSDGETENEHVVKSEALTPEAFLAAMDTDKDGHLSLAEIEARASEDGETDFHDRFKDHFDVSDANADGLLETAEVATMIKRLDAEDVAGDGEDGQGEEETPESLLQALDADKDRKVSFAEVQAKLQSAGELEQLAEIEGHFNTADANQDSFLDVAEMATFLKRFTEEDGDEEDGDEENGADSEELHDEDSDSEKGP